MIRRALAALAACFALTVHADTLDRVLYVSAQSATLVDWAQTREIVRNPNFKEGNPLLGENPSDSKIGAVMLTRMAVTHLIYTKVQDEYRTAMLASINVVWWGVVVHNHRLGVRPFKTDDKWTGPDKVKHMAAGAIAGAAVTGYTGEAWKGCAASAVLGWVKEMHDQRKGTPSMQDFAVTAAAGCAASYGTAWAVAPTRDGFAVAYNKEF